MTPRTRSWIVPAVAIAVGVAVAVIAWVAAPTTDAYVEARLWLACLVAGVLVALALVVWQRSVRRIAASRAVGVAEGLAVAAEDHRRFLLRLDHELKNPLTAIQAGLANLNGGTTAADSPAAGGPAGSSPPGTSVVASITSQTQRLARLVSDLRKLAELETQPIERHPVDLADLLGEVHETIGELPEASRRHLTLTLPRAPWPLGTVPGDRDLLFLALHNLVVNAVKFSREGDTIELRARDDGERVVVEVADTGIGIPDDEVSSIWQELARGSAATGTPGMGLGLAMVRVVVARHNGTVWVRSREGHGTVMGVGLPAS